MKSGLTKWRQDAWPQIRVSHLTFAFPGQKQPALRDVSWSANAGEFILLAGESASGKSTLLRSLNGLIPHFSGGTIEGEVVIEGRQAIEAGPQELSQLVGFVQQSPEAQAILERVEPEIAFGLENAAVPAPEMAIRVDTVLKQVELSDLRNRLLTTLSGGERQRMAIACALALRPHILALDEPTSQLDPLSAGQVLTTLVRLNRDLGLTVVIAEHRLERVLPYVDRVLYLKDGRLLVDAPPRRAVWQMPELPPLTELGRRLGWRRLPLSLDEARQSLARHELSAADSERPWPANAVVGEPIERAPAAGPGGQPLLEVSQLSFAYERETTLDQITIQVQAGELVALMGRNGSGKSSLLKCIVGLLTPDSGQIYLEGESIIGKEVAEICRRVAYLPQYPDDLLFADTVAEELAITLRNHGLEAADRVTATLSRLQLADEAAAYPRFLSAGQRQRVALGAVTVTKPALILLDEPTRGLDPATKRGLIALWRAWLSEGCGLLLVTHDVELVAGIADRVILLEDGRVSDEGDRASVLGRSRLFAPQMVQLFPGRGWLTVGEATAGLQSQTALAGHNQGSNKV